MATHVQKYFIKLANAGLPVPGRVPKINKAPKKKVIFLLLFFEGGGEVCLSVASECVVKNMLFILIDSCNHRL